MLWSLSILLRRLRLTEEEELHFLDDEDFSHGPEEPPGVLEDHENQEAARIIREDSINGLV